MLDHNAFIKSFDKEYNILITQINNLQININNQTSHVTCTSNYKLHSDEFYNGYQNSVAPSVSYTSFNNTGFSNRNITFTSLLS
jgi:hypothetical protein